MWKKSLFIIFVSIIGLISFCQAEDKNLKIVMYQMSPTVGDFKGNTQKIIDEYLQAVNKSADIFITPEMAVTGYPPYDLLDRVEDMISRNNDSVKELLKVTVGKKTLLVVGHVRQSDKSFGRPLQNALSVLGNGKVLFSQAKRLLPTYDIFDEARYFEPGDTPKPFIFKDFRIGFAICEDLWGKDTVFNKIRYSNVENPVEYLKNMSLDLLISLTASPYVMNKKMIRHKIHSEVAREVGAPLIWNNQVGATDEIMFDGRSFVLDEKGEKAIEFTDNTEGTLSFILNKNKKIEQVAPIDKGVNLLKENTEMEVLLRSLVMGLKEYFKKNRMTKAILGISGGIDSALVATLAQMALGPENVYGVAMPSQYSSEHSIKDAVDLAKNLGIYNPKNFQVRPIKDLFESHLKTLDGELPGGNLINSLTKENIQARIRGQILMAISGSTPGMLVLTTGNKSEIGMGYCTIYGDMIGAINPIGDLYKMEVYKLAKYINQTRGLLIPENTIKKEPSAELAPDQKDSDSLPPYPILDKFIEDYMENRMSATDLENKYGNLWPNHNKSWVREKIRLFEIMEFKRRQAAPILKVHQKSFGIGRRVPISIKFDK